MRLLFLKGDRQDRPLRCRIVPCATPFSPRYEALSYAWGNTSDTDMPCIICNGRERPIGRNLFEALQSLRYLDETRVLWIDALCINQSDSHEKTDQVKDMVKIYENASRTLVWLGRASPCSPNVMDIIERLDQVSVLWEEGKFGKSGVLTNKELIQNGLPGVTRAYQKSWTELSTFFKRPWFHRVWVIQEVAVSKEVDMICGPRKASWTSFANAVYFLTRMQFINPWLEMKGCTRLARIREYKEYPSDITTTDLLTLERSSLATDDRDHVFALLGLAAKFGALSNPRNQASISVDYDLPTAEVYINTALYLAKSSGTLEFLGAAGSMPRPQKNKLPSWVPDWSFPLVKYPLMGLTTFINNSYNACRNEWKVCELSNPGNRLSVRGALFDYVWDVGEALQGLPDIEKVDNQGPIFRAWRFMIQDNPDLCHRYDDVRNTFWKTITGDRRYDGSRIGPEDLEFYNTWWEFTIQQDSNELDPGVIPDEEAEEWERTWELIHHQTISFCYGRKFFITRGGYMGMGPFGMEREDMVYLVEGATVPLILRSDKRVFIGDGNQFPFQVQGKDQFQFIGDAYIHGIMDGEGFDPRACKEFVLC
jgi:hypothetical protein